ncbi:GNAT family N-acetyltransferase [Exiguobacterium sp. s48]|uniref:GNAT family N-acetyltransferase n=2 Tax=unclassified Exiguobacterium TaxID=2644629 RepID=UPI002036B999|nr:GNAT family N-acetyltransferase [Exiguobacterium sp. s48]
MGTGEEMIDYKGTVAIETNRLLLRKVRKDEAQTIFNHWLSDDRVMDNLIKGAHQSVSETISRVNEVVESYDSLEFCYWGIELKTTGQLIGSIDLFNFDSMTENCEVGYTIGYSWWNRGYGTEALKAVIDFGFKRMNIHKISAAHNLDNPASGIIMKKNGMVQEGIVRHMIRNAKNQYKDCAIYGLLQEDYLKYDEESS